MPPRALKAAAAVDGARPPTASTSTSPMTASRRWRRRSRLSQRATRRRYRRAAAAVVSYPREGGVPSPSSEEAPTGGTDAIGTLQMGHGAPALCEWGGPIRRRRPPELAERDCSPRRAPRPPAADLAAVIPSDRRARRGGGLGPRARRGGDE